MWSIKQHSMDDHHLLWCDRFGRHLIDNRPLLHLTAISHQMWGRSFKQFMPLNQWMHPWKNSSLKCEWTALQILHLLPRLLNASIRKTIGSRIWLRKTSLLLRLTFIAPSDWSVQPIHKSTKHWCTSLILTPFWSILWTFATLISRDNSTAFCCWEDK